MANLGSSDQQAMMQIERLHRTHNEMALLERLCSRPHFWMGALTIAFDQLVDTSGRRPPPPMPNSPQSRSTLQIATTLPGIKSKRHAPYYTLQQEAASCAQDDLPDTPHLYTEGLLLPVNGAAMAACVVPAINEARNCRLVFGACSTTAQLAGIHVACNLIEEILPLSRAAVLIDSRAALQILANERKAPSTVLSLTTKMHPLD